MPSKDPFSQPTVNRLSNFQVPGVNGGRRYKLPMPGDTSKKATFWVSATTVAKCVDDTFMLSQWQQRKVAQGLCAKPELYAEACSLEWESADEDRANAIKLIDKARDAAGANYGSTMGTAYHKYTELTDDGQISRVPVAHRETLQAYQNALTEAGIKPVYEYTERACVVSSMMLSGTMDRVYSGRDFDGLVIGDVKTAKNVRLGMTSIAAQLAIYANATHVFDLGMDTYQEMPNVRKDVALVVWLPVLSGKCELLWVDIARGWDIAKLALNVYNARKMNDSLVTPYGSLEAANYAEQIRQATTKAELSQIWKCASGAGQWTDELAELGKQRAKEFTQ